MQTALTRNQDGTFSLGGKRYRTYDYFAYSVDIAEADLLPNSSVSVNFNIQRDSDFVWTMGTFFENLAGAAQQNGVIDMPPATVQIIDTGSGRALLETPAPVTSLFGTGSLPFILPVPRVFDARSTIVVQLSNYGTSAFGLGLTFIGYKAYPV